MMASRELLKIFTLSLCQKGNRKKQQSNNVIQNSLNSISSVENGQMASRTIGNPSLFDVNREQKHMHTKAI